jgi:hypothetical protein
MIFTAGRNGRAAGSRPFVSHTVLSKSLILRLDRLLTALRPAKSPSPDAAAAAQELIGGKFGEMSTLMNYTF